MKKAKFLSILIPLFALSFTLVSCDDASSTSSESKSFTKVFIDKPEDTNLEYWITERVSGETMRQNGCTYLPGWFGAEEYLDSRYTAIEEEGSMAKAPEIHVTYLLSGYPDAMDPQGITEISITDETITVYGLTMDSSAEEIKEKMESISATKQESNSDVEVYLYERCTFSFSKHGIFIRARTTNIHGIVY